MTVYIVTVNGSISSEAYKTMTEAQEFCKQRHDNPEMVGNGWCFISGENIYKITDVHVDLEARHHADYQP